jgi:hypothetical protein
MAVRCPAGAGDLIITYGTNTPDWNAKLGISGMRGGCSLEPEVCVKNAEVSAKSQHVNRYYVTMQLDPKTATMYAARFAVLSRTHPTLYEIDIDDFVNQYTHLADNFSVDNPYDLVDSVITAVKSGSANLRFGITLYEDELTSSLLSDASLPLPIREKVDTVHLYLHYRGNADNYDSYVNEAQVIFPKSVIIGGSYAYDRIDYVPCYQGADIKCSVEEEFDLFRDSLRTQVRLLHDHRIAGIEFYPASFGAEARWYGWSNSKICAAERKSRCIDNTVRMRNMVLQYITEVQPRVAPRD